MRKCVAIFSRLLILPVFAVLGFIRLYENAEASELALSTTASTEDVSQQQKVNKSKRASASRSTVDIANNNNSNDDNNVSSRTNNVGRVAKTVSAKKQSTDTNSSARRSATSTVSRVKSAGTTSRTAVNNKTAASSRNVVSQPSKSGTDRATLSRAGKNRTEVFNDATKIADGYSECRDAFSNCMDQFCMAAGSVYGRCYCSDKYKEFSNSFDNLQTAAIKLDEFQNNNLNVVDKTAEEVTAMYSVNVGENMDKKDNSATQNFLDDVGDVLSGKDTKNTSASIGSINMSDLVNFDDVWSDKDDENFDVGQMGYLAFLQGQALYSHAAKQCAELVKNTCPNDKQLNLAIEAYYPMITRDCNQVNKKMVAQKIEVLQTVKKAEQFLKETRLDEYQAHNSKDFVECLAAVENTIQDSGVCGAGYAKCLDYTGNYIDNDGKYTDGLFQLSTIAPNVDEEDIVNKNTEWNKYLDMYKSFAASELDTCRDLADDVWKTFKRNAMISIAQAQEAKIQEVKDSCVKTIKDCYNTYDETLSELTEIVSDAKLSTGAGRAVTVRGFCKDKVLACAALYGDPNGCIYNTTTKKIEANAGAQCGMQELLSYIDSVDTISMVQSCEQVVLAKVHEMCDVDTSSTITTYSTSSSTTTARAAVKARAGQKLASTLPTYREAQELAKSNLMKNSGLLDKIGNSASETQSSQFRILPINTGFLDKIIIKNPSEPAKYPDGCLDKSLDDIYGELQYHADQYCALDFGQNDRSNVNVKDKTTLNLDSIQEAVDNVYKKLCVDLGYSADLCKNKTISDKNPQGEYNGVMGAKVCGSAGVSKEQYNKDDAHSTKPLFICYGGGSSKCPFGSWLKDGKCVCQPGTEKKEQDAGSDDSAQAFECENDGYVNPYTFSNTTNYSTSRDAKGNPDPDFVDWSDELSVYWYWYHLSGEDVAQQKTGMTFVQAFDKQNDINLGSCIVKPKTRLWKAYGITASNGKQKVTLDVVGQAKCIGGSANLDDKGGPYCVCGVKSVSSGSIQEKWVYTDHMFGFYMGNCYQNINGICEDTCADRCASDFARDDYNIRYSLMKSWKPQK